MFGKKNKTLWDYVSEHNPYNEIIDLIQPSYLEGTVTSEHKELANDINEYWDLLHPLVQDFINSYGLTLNKMNEELQLARDNLENSRRQLTFEQQNVQDLSDQVREIKGELQNVLVIKRDLETRLEDEREMLQKQFNEEKRALQLIAESKFDKNEIDKIVGDVRSGIGDSDEVKRLQKKVEEFEQQIQKEREENEKIQEELSTSFMEKIQRSDAMIQNLKARLNE